MIRRSEESGEGRKKISRSTRKQIRLNDPSTMRRCQTCKGIQRNDSTCSACHGQGGVNLGNI
jgi:DnaJ-class molecular chaperone